MRHEKRFCNEIRITNPNTRRRMETVCNTDRFPVYSLFPESTKFGDVYRVDCRRLSVAKLSALADFFKGGYNMDSATMQRHLLANGFTIAAEDCAICPWPPFYMTKPLEVHKRVDD